MNPNWIAERMKHIDASGIRKVFDLAAKLEAHILSAGGSADAAELYTRFRGRMPGPEALLQGRGLLDVA